MKPEKILQKILNGSKSISFFDFHNLLIAYGFYPDRVSGSHHILKKNGVDELINIQNFNGEVKSYQLKQFLKIIEKYNLKLERN